MKRIFEILLSTFFIFILVYILLYFLLFNSICDNFSWSNEMNPKNAILQLANCKDSLICSSSDLKFNSLNELTYWKCEKSISPLFKSDLYLWTYNHFINSITK